MIEGERKPDPRIREFVLPLSVLASKWTDTMAHQPDCDGNPNLLSFVQTFTEKPISNPVPYAEPDWRSVRHIALRCRGCHVDGEDIFAQKSVFPESVVREVVLQMIDIQMEATKSQQSGMGQIQ